jgi:DNA-binding CsgD family transcriptional regulator
MPKPGTTESAILRRVFDEGLVDEARIVLVEGAAGSGKSHLLDAITEHALRNGAVTLRAVAREGEARPLSLLHQLLLSPSLPAGAVRRLSRVLEEARRSARSRHFALRDSRARHVELLYEFGQALRELAAERPLLLAIDDLGHADEESLEYLLHAVRQCRDVRLLTVATKSVHRDLEKAAVHTELLRQPHFHRIRLQPLDESQVADVIATYPVARSPVLVESCYAISGGNPLVLRALLEDHLLATGEHPERPGPAVVGEAYAEAILTCVHRAGARVSEVAEGLAVLGDQASAEHLGRLLAILPATVPQAVEELNASGVLDGLRFRHPDARVAVLDHLDAARREGLHRRAAALLHAAGAPAAAVAEHLRAAPGTGAPWEAAVFQEAAEQALAEDRPGHAISCLEQAQKASRGMRQHTGIQFRLAIVSRRISPGAVDQYLAGPLAAVRSGGLAAPHFGPLARLLAAQGRMDEAREVLERLHVLGGGGGSTAEARAQLAALYASSAPPSVPLAGAEVTHQAVMPWSMVEGGAGPDAVAAAEDLLRLSELTDSTLDPLLSALKLLSHSDRPSRALHWCDVLLRKADQRQAPGWQVVLACIGAGAAVRLGRLAEAETLARRALALIPERDSVFVAGPVSLLVQICTLTGRHEEATQYLNRPMPEALLGNVLGMHYRRARGRYCRATQRNHAALRDYLAVGALAERWGLDHAVIVPWRADAAGVLLALGSRGSAERYAADQIERTDDTTPRGRRLVLRMRAALAPLRKRPAQLAQVVAELEETEDRLELVGALLDLAETYDAVGDRGPATEVAGRALRLARECGARALGERALRHTWESPGRSADGPGGPMGRLSDSERRVAALAAAGQTNREIAGKLYITMSTVEQHLTRVYRKLDIQGRQELPPDLWPEGDDAGTDPAGPPLELRRAGHA